MLYTEMRKLTKEEAKHVILHDLERDTFIEEIATEIVPDETGTLQRIDLTHSPAFCKDIVSSSLYRIKSYGSVYTNDLAMQVAAETIKQNIDTVAEWITSKCGVLRLSASFPEDVGFYYTLENGVFERHETNTVHADLLRDCEENSNYAFAFMRLEATP